MKIKRLLCQVLLLSFLLGIQDGFVALWKDDDPKPLRVFPYRADSLPEEDQKRLRDGIRIDTKEQLLQLLEDYLS